MAEKRKIPEKKKIVIRLTKIEGHIKSIKRMIEEEKPCRDILIQLLAVKSAVIGASKAIILNYLDNCLDKQKGSKNVCLPEEFKNLLQKYLG